MNDPRLNSEHLTPPRRGFYGEARERVLGALGQETREAERAMVAGRPSPFEVCVSYALRLARWPVGQPPASFERKGRTYPLRVGITAIGRADENDLIIPHTAISRRHCVIVVHATGGCEVRDTASRHGILVNGHKVDHAVLCAGDLIRLCDFEFLVLADRDASSWPVPSLGIDTTAGSRGPDTNDTLG